MNTSVLCLLASPVLLLQKLIQNYFIKVMYSSLYKKKLCDISFRFVIHKLLLLKLHSKSCLYILFQTLEQKQYFY